MVAAAARVSDMHTCPMVTPGAVSIPHVGGPILPPGALTVLIGAQPAATVGDSCVCNGPLDTIVSGWVAAAVAAPAGVRVGVDLAEMERVSSRHAQAVLSGDEWEVLAPYASVRPALAWALKEAAAKATGDPLRCFPCGLRIEEGPAGLMVQQVAGGRRRFVTGWGLFGGFLYVWVRGCADLAHPATKVGSLGYRRVSSKKSSWRIPCDRHP